MPMDSYLEWLKLPFISAKELPRFFRLAEKVEEIRNAKACIKSNDHEFFTNLYYNDYQLTQWIINGQLFIFNDNDTLILIRVRKGFCQLYFSTDDLDAMFGKLKIISKEVCFPISLDLINVSTRVSAGFINIGFKLYCSLTRMTKMNTATNVTSVNDLWFANTNETAKLERIIYENMNPLCEQIPDFQEIKHAVENRQILVIRSEIADEVNALLFFERIGVTSTLKFWSVKKHFQGLGLGSLLYKRYISVNADAKRYLLWVRNDNDKVINIYKNYGMKLENLHDEVYVLKRSVV